MPMDSARRHRLWLALLAAAFAAEWAALAIHPWFRQDLALENVLVAVAVAALAVGRPALSPAAWLMLFAFASMHIVGAHYTYAEVPYDRWARALT